jgi:3-methylcrotonyl-CoA carboxylase alpha subunit
MRIRDLRTGEERDVAGSSSLPSLSGFRGILAARDDSGVVWVWSRGETYRLARATGRPVRGAQDAEHDLFAPMPGKVVRVLAAEGESVTKGSSLLVLEAMKMEHTIRAPRDGVVKSLKRTVGEMVGLGDKLAEIE